MAEIQEEKVVAQEKDGKKKEYKEGRFEFALFVNNHLVCKRNFNIPNYIEGSMNTVEFRDTVDDIVEMIDNDLKSKSRVYTWYTFNPERPQDAPEFSEPLLAPYESEFKLTISDNRRTVIEKIWDGYGYPRAIRDRVDIANKSVKFTTKDGKQYVYEKEAYFAENENRLSTEMYILRAMIMDKEDLLVKIIHTITDELTGADGGLISDFNQTMKYGNKEYTTNVKALIRKYYAELGKKYAQKTRDYLDPYRLH